MSGSFSLVQPSRSSSAKYVYLGQVTPSQLVAWFLTPGQNLPGEVQKKEKPSSERRLSKKQESERLREEALMRRFRLTAKHKRAKVVCDGWNKPVGITWKDDGKQKRGGTKQTAGASAFTAMKKSTATEIGRFWLATRTCGHCKERGLWSKGSLGQCQACGKFTKLA